MMDEFIKQGQTKKMEQRREVSEIVRRNVKQVIQTLLEKGLAFEQTLINHYLNGQKSQYEFLLPKSKNHSYYRQQLTSTIPNPTERKLPRAQPTYNNFEHEHQQYSQNHTKTLTVVGKVEQISVGAMCELIKELGQNNQPYQPFDNQIYEQQLTLNLSNPGITAKISSILDMVNSVKNPSNIHKNTIEPENPNTKMDFIRTELGTEKDGSMGAWGGKKYQGLGMRDQFTNYRKQFSKNFYHQAPR